MREENLNPELEEVEALLGGLKPARVIVDRDRLMFKAGRGSACQRSRWVWPGIAAALAVSLVGVLLHRPAPQQVERIVYVPAELAQPSVPPGPAISPAMPTFEPRPAPVLPTIPNEGNYLQLRREVLEHGVDALPTGTGYAGDPVTVRHMLGRSVHEGGPS